jgi:parallel beta-helix repeat protein
VLFRSLSTVNFQTGVPGRFTTVQGHNVDGILVRKESLLAINGVSPHVISGNGAACPLNPTCGGILAENNSTVHMIAGGTVSGNQGSGISAQQGTNLILGSDLLLNGPAVSNNTISNNSGDGVHIQWISVGNFLSGNTITGNGGASVSCDERSLVVGDLSAFSNVKCGEIERPNGVQHEHEDKDRRRQ